MAKAKDRGQDKNVKRAAQKSIKEKRAERKEKQQVAAQMERLMHPRRPKG